MKARIFTMIVTLFIFCHVMAQVDGRLLRYPDVSETHITFVYGGDLWIVSRDGGLASRLSSPAGNEMFPKFSPDGSEIAFSGNYDGNTDIYVLPSQGGVPRRLTHHGMSDRLLDWYPDGEHLLYVTSMHSGKQRFSQFYKISSQGGLPEKLPMAYGEFGSLSPDGDKIAFTDRTRIFRTWKRYRGGTAADIWIFDLNTLASTNITDNDANDELPMWQGDKVYYLSDDGPNQRFNIWVYDTKEKTTAQVTKFEEDDVHFPSIGPDAIVFEAGGQLYLLDLQTGTYHHVEVQVITDLLADKPFKEGVHDYMRFAAVSPDGNRAVVEARGEIFSVPGKKGFVQNLTRTSGVAERFPSWSPDGKYIAYWSDQSGEYELTIRDLTKGAEEKTLTKLGPGFRYALFWAPNSKRLAFVDQTMHIHIYDFEKDQVEQIDQDPFLFEGGLRNWRASWSSDSQWLTYSKTLDNRHSAIMLYNAENGVLRQVTSGFYSEMHPVFDEKGDYLFCMTNRAFKPVYSDFDNSWIYPNATQLAVVPLRDDVDSPLAAENDTVAISIATDDDEPDHENGGDSGSDDAGNDQETDVEIDPDDFERRMIILPPVAGNMSRLAVSGNKVLYMRYPNSGSAGEKPQLMFYDLEEREEKTIIEDVRAYELSADGKKLLVRKGDNLAIIDVAPDQKMEETLALEEMEMTIVPRKEWKQIFQDAWRLERDFFYDSAMHGVDWDAIREQYEGLVDHCVTRADVNFIIGEMIGELNASHTYRGGGDQEDPKSRQVGYLGVDWQRKGDLFAIREIVRGAPWDSEVRSPLDAPGIAIAEGDYILAVNGIALSEYTDPWAAFEGLAGKTVELTYNDRPSWEDAKKAIVKTLKSETRLRNLAWINANRKRVEEASGGQIGYIYVPSTGRDGQNELARQFYAQWDKPGLIVDERFNNGGQIPDRFIELLNRKPLAYWSVRDGKNWQWPPVAHFGSMAMLINGWAGSGGDAFPDYFKKAGLGPLVGSRTWGGLIGISGAPPLIDGGVVTVPTFRMYHPDGSWFEEGHGVEPDIEVRENPTMLAKGIDPQLEKAIDVVMEQIRKKGPIHPKEPSKEDRSRKGKT